MRWQSFVNALFVGGLVLLSQCSRIDCIGGTMETRTKDYAGDKNATAPYADKTKLKVSSGCDTAGCDYILVARVCLHNPLDKDKTADVHCDYYAGAWKAQSNERKAVEVAQHSSKCVELQQIITGISRSLEVGATCITTWQPPVWPKWPPDYGTW